MDCGNDKSILGLNSNSNWFFWINDCIKEWLYQEMVVLRNGCIKNWVFQLIIFVFLEKCIKNHQQRKKLFLNNSIQYFMFKGL